MNRGYDGLCLPSNGDWFVEGQPAEATPGASLCCTPAVSGSGGGGAGGSGYDFCLLTEDLDDIDIEGAPTCITPEG